MKRKIILGVLGVLIIIAGGVLFLGFNKEKENKNSLDDVFKDKKVLVVYFSAQNHTKKVANEIASKINADVFEVVPVNKYSEADLDWTNNNSRVSKENNNEELKNVELVSTKVDNWDSYEIVMVGYPIWWGEAAWPINNFMKNNNFEGKTIIPFCTSASSSILDSVEELKKITTGGNWQDGKRFDSSATEEEINNWISTLNK